MTIALLYESIARALNYLWLADVVQEMLKAELQYTRPHCTRETMAKSTRIIWVLGVSTSKVDLQSRCMDKKDSTNKTEAVVTEHRGSK